MPVTTVPHRFQSPVSCNSHGRLLSSCRTLSPANEKLYEDTIYSFAVVGFLFLLLLFLLLLLHPFSCTTPARRKRRKPWEALLPTLRSLSETAATPTGFSISLAPISLHCLVHTIFQKRVQLSLLTKRW